LPLNTIHPAHLPARCRSPGLRRWRAASPRCSHHAAATTLEAPPAAAADAKQRYSRIVSARQQAAEIRARVATEHLRGGLLYVDGAQGCSCSY
jgi:hypothetical protein